MTRTRATLAPALGLLLLLPLAACSGDDPSEPSEPSEPSSAAADTERTASSDASPSAPDTSSPAPSASSPTAPAPDEQPTATPSSSATASSEPAPTGGTVSPAPGAPTADGGQYGQLLNASELPGFDDDWAWQEYESVPREDGPFTLCQRFLFSDVGATEVVVRRFDAAVAGADGDTAGELVATFPDVEQAQRATSVLRSWAEDCSPENGSVQADVSPWTRVQVADGTGAWYAVTVNPDEPEQTRTERTTVVQRGNRVAVVRSELLGRPRDYPAAQDPAALSARPAASKLTG